MQSLTGRGASVDFSNGPRRMRRESASDPAPSRLSYRATRLWLTPVFRKMLGYGLPALAMAGAVLWYISDDARVEAIRTAASEVRREVEDRPEFRVNVLGIDGASATVTEEVRAALALTLPLSSFDLDLDELRGRVEALPPVRAADLRIQSGGYLAVQIDERVPAVIWQTYEGASILDATGHFIAGYGTREMDSALPVIGGEGADRVVDEALELIAAAAPLGARLQGLVRMGERRWDVVLTDGTRILLPEHAPRAALDHVLAMNDVGEILSRDIAAVDLRNPARPTVRLTETALETLRAMRARGAGTLSDDEGQAG